MIENGSIFDFGDGCEKVTVGFDGVGSTSLVELRIDSENGDAIGIVALSSTGFGDGESTAPIKRTCGKHKVYMTMHDSGYVTSLRFHNESAPEYIPARACKSDYSDTWEATDMLGRRIPSVEDVKGKKTDKKVGIFYWTWRENSSRKKAVSVAEVLAEHPAAEYNRNHPAWGGDNSEIECHWTEPLYGYYKNSDPYVIRKHASMLAAAGVDFLVFDCTNGSFLWRNAYEPLMEGLRQAKDDGINVPKVVFMLNFAPFHYSQYMLRALYQDMYGIGKYSDLWYMLDGKPLIMAYPECIPAEGICDTDTEILNKIRGFFTFRAPQPLYGRENGGPSRPDHWGWLEIAPQNKYGVREDGSCEQVTVGVAQNANDNRICTCFNDDVPTYGRSYTHKYGHALVTEDSYKYGYNVQEQWDRAIDIDPDHVFITGWNEWNIGLHNYAPWIMDPDSTKLGMVDQYDLEHSRDIEPDKNGYLDTYYLQMAANIRRYKGCVQRQKTSEPKSIDMKGGISQWADVTPVYKNHKGTAANRDWDGYKGWHYENKTGVNDIVGAQVCRDADSIYFLAKCSENVKDAYAEGMMTLYIDADRSKETGWEGYDIRINGMAGKRGYASVEVYAPTAEENSFTWTKIGMCAFRVVGKTAWLQVSRELIGMQGDLNFEFKWSDNLIEKNAVDFYVNGCAAPIGRFNYLYKE